MPRWRMLAALMLVIGAAPWVLLLGGIDGGVIYHTLCHQLPERTLHVHGDAMAVCSRCAGIYLGVALGAVLASTARSHTFFSRHGRALVVVAIGLNLADWAWSVWMPLSHASRLTVGGAFGLVATAYMLSALARASLRREPQDCSTWSSPRAMRASSLSSSLRSSTLS